MSSTDEEVQRKASWGTDFLNSDDWGDGGGEPPRFAVKAAALSEGLALETDRPSPLLFATYLQTLA